MLRAFKECLSLDGHLRFTLFKGPRYKKITRRYLYSLDFQSGIVFQQKNWLLLATVDDCGNYDPDLISLPGWIDLNLKPLAWTFMYARLRGSIFIPCKECDDFDKFLTGVCSCGFKALELFSAFYNENYCGRSDE